MYSIELNEASGSNCASPCRPVREKLSDTDLRILKTDTCCDCVPTGEAMPYPKDPRLLALVLPVLMDPMEARRCDLLGVLLAGMSMEVPCTEKDSR